MSAELSEFPFLSVMGCSVLFVAVRQLIPEDLAAVAPGPELAGVLAAIQLSRLSGYDCVEVLKAQYRQLNHERARLMAAMVEVGLCGIGPDEELRRMPVPDEFSADEIRAALMLTRRAADAQFWLAYDLLTRLPAVHAALDTGVLDEPRARVLSEWTIELHPQTARALCAELLPRAPGLTTGQLIEQIKKLAIALDPDWARRRYEHALAERKVIGHRNPDGSANLSGCNLPVDRVAAACGHIDALAKAAEHAGDSRPLDHIRADLFLGMTDGTYAGLDDTAILAHLRTTHGNEDRPNSDDGEGSKDDTGPNDDGPHDDGPDDCGGTTEGGGPHDDGGIAEDDRCTTDDPSRRAPADTGLELRVRLSTLLGHDDHPAELAGWGPVHAELARELTTTLGGAQWRFAITDEHGHLTHGGITQARPTGTPTRRARCRAIVELQIPATTLHTLASTPDTLSTWEPVITDLTHQNTNAHQPAAKDPTQRFPDAALRRHLQIRDRSCVMIGCRAPAHGTDTDHTLDHARSGATTEHNLGNVCRHDHRLKHDGGWQLDQLQPGHFHWTSRLGHTYYRQPPAIIEPLPDPIPRDQPPYPLTVSSDDGWEATQIWKEPPAEPEPDPPPETNPDDDVPPF